MSAGLEGSAREVGVQGEAEGRARAARRWRRRALSRRAWRITLLHAEAATASICATTPKGEIAPVYPVAMTIGPAQSARIVA